MKKQFWTILSQMPVIAPGNLHPPQDAARAGAAHVVAMGDVYRMVYWGTDQNGRNSILAAEASRTSLDTWQPVGGTLITAQPESDHNCRGPGFPFLLPVSASRWLLYFTGWGRRADGKLPNTTGVAVSDDGGRRWSYLDRHPVIPLDRDYDREGTGSLWILRDDDRFRMYYTAIGEYRSRPDGVATGHGDVIPSIGIAYAESVDGLTWTKPFDRLAVAPRGFAVEPYEYICSKPCVIRDDDGYTMWVNTFGTAYRVHRLVSQDGLTWQWAPRWGSDGELGTGLPGGFDDHQRSYPTMVRDGRRIHCWYTGNNFGTTGIGHAVAST